MLLFYLILYSRIVSLGPIITEKLYILGCGDKIIGNTIYCTRPDEAKKKEKVGDVININVEKILELTPDLVLATDLTNKNAVERLKELGIEIRIVGNPRNFAELCDQFIELGKILDKEDTARKIIEKVKKDADSIKNANKKLIKLRVAFQIGSNPLFFAGKDYFLNDFINFVGCTNIFEKSGIYSREAIIKENPDVIIILGMGIGEKEKIEWLNYKTINAVKNKKIFIIEDEYKFCSPTPVSFIEGVKELSAIIHKN